ncbi:MAG: hypothetical protein IJS65_03575 [Clostridia bacterium]|nr:hypothetical protein [Clostridia bacterium]
MKKLIPLIVLILCVCLLCSCSLTQPGTDGTAGARLPSSEGIDWNKTASGKGKAARPAGFELPISFTSASLPYKTHNIEYHYDDVKINAYMPDLFYIGDEAVREKLTSFCKGMLNDFFDEVLALEVPNKPDRVTSAEAYASCYTDVLSDYIVINFTTSYYFTTYRYDENGNTVYDDPDEPLSGYTDDYFVFDLRTGERLMLADLFYSDADYAERLNTIIAKDLDEEYDGIKRPFEGIPENYENFRLSSGGGLDITFPDENPYTEYSYTVSIPLWKIRDIIALKPTDEALFSEEAKTSPDQYGDTLKLYDVYLDNSDYIFDIETLENGDTTIKLRSTDPDAPDLTEINETLKKINDDVLASDAWQKAKKDEYNEVNYDCSVTVNLVNINISVYYGTYDDEGNWQYDDYGSRACYDLNTGKQLFLSDVITSEAEAVSYINGDLAADSEDTFAPPANFSAGLPVNVGTYGASFIYDGEYYYLDLSCIKPTVWSDTK